MMIRLVALVALSLFCIQGRAEAPAGHYVSAILQGQFGNQLFQIAAAYAYSLDHGIPLIIPDFVHKSSWNARYNAERLFLHKIAHHDLPRTPVVWNEPNFNYNPIPASKRLQLCGYFQTDKYFQHRRKEILELFAPPPDLQEKILKKYPFLTSDRLTVGVQIRDYRPEFPAEDFHPTHTRVYYEKAFAHFPDDALFIVTSNNANFAKECTQGLKPHILYLDSNDYIEDFYALCMCKSFIISNSSFGWWAAWLSVSPNKTVIAPRPWFAPPYDDEMMTKDLILPGFQTIKIDR